jgi:hypothetical protein
MDDKQRALDECLNELANPNLSLDETRIEEYIAKFQKVYDSGFRHLYSRLFGVVSSIQGDSNLDTTVLAGNIEKIYHKVVEKAEQGRSGVNEEFRSRMEKLYDHVNLDISRLTYTERIVGEVNQKYSVTRAELLKLGETAKNMQRDYVTILGIFAAIILAFVAGITFSTSVLSNIDKVSIYRLAFVMLMIALLLFNLLNMLLEFVERVSGRSLPGTSHIKDINTMIFLLLTIDIIWWGIYWYRITP